MLKRISRRSRPAVRVALVALLLVVVSLATSACRTEKTFTDGIGRAVKIKGTPQRIVSVNPAHTETLFSLGLGDKVVGVDEYSYRPAEAAKKEKVGDAFNLNLEKIVSLKPDLVIIAGSKDMPPAQLADMERLGIPTYVSGPSTVEEVLADIEALAKVVGAEKQGKELVEGLRKDLLAVTESLSEASSLPRVFIVVDPNLWTVGPTSFLSDVVETAGCVNVMEREELQYLQVSMEILITKDPDAIVVTIPEDQAPALTSMPGWDSLRAVKEGKVYFVDPDIVARPGPAVVQGIKDVAEALRGE